MDQAQHIRIILSQGRIGDRTVGAIPGAAALAGVLARRYGLTLQPVGEAAPARTDNWDAALHEAEATLRRLAEAVADRLRDGRRALVVANTCSASLATLPAAAGLIPDVAVLWIDAHGDYNTPATTASGYLGGMALAGASGLWDSGHGAGIDPARTLLVGARDIDPPEAALIEAEGVRVISPAATEARTIADWIGKRPVWIHIDWDVMEPGLIPAAYAVPGGLRPEQLASVLKAIPAAQIIGVELAELELPDDPAEGDRALGAILDIVAPLFA